VNPVRLGDRWATAIGSIAEAKAGDPAVEGQPKIDVLFLLPVPASPRIVVPYQATGGGVPFEIDFHSNGASLSAVRNPPVRCHSSG
jgi:hypothetical protein